MGSLVKATAASQMDPQIWPNARVPTIKIDEEVLSPVVDVSGIDPVVGSDNSVRPSIPGRSSASLHSLSEDQKNHEQSLRPRFLERARSITFSDPETLPIENYSPQQFSLETLRPLETDFNKYRSVDIVLVNLLWQEPDLTWTHHQDDSSEFIRLPKKKGKRRVAIRNVNWLTDDHMLPSVAPYARVLRFGYRLPLPTHDPEARLDFKVIAKNLLVCLTKERKDFPDRPLIFIGHAWGGVIIEHALVAAFRPTEEAEPILNSVAGIIFLATPVKGSDAAISRVAEQINLSPKDSVFNNVRARSGKLQELLNKFTYIVKERAVSIICLYPKSNSESVNYNSERGGLMNDYTIDGLTNIPLDSDLNKVGKFAGPDDKSYLVVRDLIIGFINDVAVRSFLLAAKENRQDDVREMLDGVITADAQDRYGRTALHMAVETVHIEMVRLLLGQGGANVNISDNEGMRAIHFAVMKKEPDIIRLLLQKNAEIKAQNNKGQSAVDLAEQGQGQGEGDAFLDKGRAVLDLLKNRPLVEGPTCKPAQRGTTLFEQPPPLEGMREACEAFQVTIAEFFFDGEKERRVLEQPSVYELIYGGGPDIILDQAREKGIDEKPVCRWYHLPANNMAWVEALFLKIGFELPSQLWAGQIHGSSQPNSRFMRPHARTVRSWAGGLDQKILAFFMPYLSYETNRSRLEMSRVINRVIHQQLQSDMTEDWVDDFIRGFEKQSRKALVPPVVPLISNKLYAKSSASLRESWNSEYPGTRTSSANKADALAHTFPNNAHSKSSYTQARELRSKALLHSCHADELLVKAYLNHKSPLHIRRTLDQSFYYMLADTTKRDRDQVVYRHIKSMLEEEVRIESGKKQNRGQRVAENPDDASTEEIRLDAGRKKKLQEAKIFMVDQLWLWMIPAGGKFESDIVVSSFPQRWRQPPYDALDLQNLVLNYPERPPVTSVYDMVTLITTRCINVLDRSQVPGDLQFLDFFESSIGNVADKESGLFTKFGKISEKLSRLEAKRHKRQRARRLNSLFDITQETKLLVEIKDIRDEINMVLSVLKDQRTVLRNLASELNTKNLEMEAVTTVMKSFKIRNVTRPSAKPNFDGVLFRDRHQMVERNINDFERMDQHARETHEALNHLLDLKQKQANAWEARFAREGGEETTKQGTTLLVFTIVTIIFLPLSFLASFLALNISEFPKDPVSGNTLWHLRYVSKYLFGISVAVSVPFIIIAFSVNWVKRSWEIHVLEWLNSVWERIPNLWRGILFGWHIRREQKRKEKEMAKDKEDETDEDDDIEDIEGIDTGESQLEEGRLFEKRPTFNGLVRFRRWRRSSSPHLVGWFRREKSTDEQSASEA